jgi:inositol phosphorylceramide mannosyltransferase catalytic subunit
METPSHRHVYRAPELMTRVPDPFEARDSRVPGRQRLRVSTPSAAIGVSPSPRRVHSIGARAGSGPDAVGFSATAAASAADSGAPAASSAGGAWNTWPEGPTLGPTRIDRGIPKVIIQTGRHRALPLLQRAVVANIRLLNPDFAYRFFDDADVAAFVSREFPQYGGVFDGFPYPIQRYDFFRYLAIYRYGGFYLDLDVLLASSLTPLIECGGVFPFDDLSISRFLRRTLGMDWTIGNYAFGATPGHPLLAAVIQNCIRAQEDPEWLAPALRDIPRPFRQDFVVLNSTGPMLLSRTLAENRALASDVAILFPDDVRDPASWHKFGRLGVHLMEGSWRRKEGPLRRRLRMLWEWQEFSRLMKDSARLGPTRSL